MHHSHGPLDLDHIQPGPIRHKDLPESLLARIKKCHTTFAEVDPTPLDKAIEDFRRDGHPEKEIAVWEKIAAAYQDVVIRDPLMSLEEKQQLFAKLILASTKDDPVTVGPDPETGQS